MAFLCPFERSMDVILTQHGRKKLSEGKLIVKYYKFSDPEVDYVPKMYYSGTAPVSTE